MSDQTPPVSSTYELYPPMEISEPDSGQRYWLHGLLLVGTLFTMLVMGARMHYNFVHGYQTFLGGDLKMFPVVWVYHNPSVLLTGIPFALTLMVILLCHEMGHYLYCVYYGVDATLPFFIPFPSPIGTLGAFIRIRSAIRSRSQLFDIGIAGPVAGFLAALIVLVFALALSRPIPDGIQGGPEVGLPLVFSSVYFFLGKLGLTIPAQFGLQSVALHPMAIAAWVGMFATALNLLPGGQLDGGHIVYSLIPRGHRWVSRLTILGLVLMMYFWWGWGFWAVLLRMSGAKHPQVAPWPDMNRERKWFSFVAAVLLLLTFVPQPFRRSGAGEFPMGFRDWVQDYRQQLSSR